MRLRWPKTRALADTRKPKKNRPRGRHRAMVQSRRHEKRDNVALTNARMENRDEYAWLERRRRGGVPGYQRSPRPRGIKAEILYPEAPILVTKRRLCPASSERQRAHLTKRPKLAATFRVRLRWRDAIVSTR